MKFGRSYLMTVEGNTGEEVNLQFPLTLNLDVQHFQLSASNTASFSLINLSARHRELISFNQYSKGRNYKLTLRAGYLSEQSVDQGLWGNPKALPVIFNGYINVAFTERQGSDLITHITCFDNGLLTMPDPGVIMAEGNWYTAPARTPWKTVVLELMNRLAPAYVFPGKPDAVIVPADQLPKPSAKPRPFFGSVWENLQTLAGDVIGSHLFIENGRCFLLAQNSTLGPNSLGILDSTTGLIGIPKHVGETISCKCIFEPALAVGRLIELRPAYNNATTSGKYKIISYGHQGSISGVESGSLMSEIELMSTESAGGMECTP